MDILTILIVLVYEMEYFSFSSLFSFISVLQFSVYGPFAFLIKIIPKCFILFSCYSKCSYFFLISLFDSLLVLYRNATDFCILILYPETLLNFFISSNSFLLSLEGLYWWKSNSNCGWCKSKCSSKVIVIDRKVIVIAVDAKLIEVGAIVIVVGAKVIEVKK